AALRPYNADGPTRVLVAPDASCRLPNEPFVAGGAIFKSADVSLPALARDKGHHLKDQRGAGGAQMTVDAWAMAAECARAVEASENPTRRAVLRALQKLWIVLGEKERLLSEQEVLKEMEDLHALHVQVLGTESSAP